MNTKMKKYITKNDVKVNKGKRSLIMEGAFYQTPKALLKNKKYHELTNAAVIVYMELWDRIGLSIINEMQDEKGHYYVKMSREKSEEEIGINYRTFDRAKKQLIEMGLLEVDEINKRVHHLYVFRPEETEETLVRPENESGSNRFPKGFPEF